MKQGKEFLGKRIKEIRKTRKMTQEKLAELICVDPKYISRLETGNSTPSLDTIMKISEALDIEAAELFNFSYLDEKENLIEQILVKLHNTNSKNVRLVYGITNMILSNN